MEEEEEEEEEEEAARPLCCSDGWRVWREPTATGRPTEGPHSQVGEEL